MTTTDSRAKRRLIAIPALVLALGATLTACGDSESPGAASPTPTATTDDAAPTTSEDTVDPSDLTPITPPPALPGDQGALPTGPVPDQVVDRADVQAAVAAEAQRRGVDVSAVSVAGFAEVTWTDGSLGCPQPGMMYTQALVPGHQLILEVDGQLASYHAAQGRDFAYCASPVPPAPGGLQSR
ncbi:hypothetical protein [Ornithinimicrobium cerasi]|uniref:hypothetical protein n=1 Tax=Ornithinimicrobium cerasi TaxID=2248773 RepID=UPI000EFDFC66|nr:hypothetical protein [Ornithinimicrobium cerasi]